ncbi:hypothetical protein [Saezia sanguinis]|uniref:hypothetical protein n=1 Tax=Saezia sanguinis TaxID=1965230 RepID=UPI003021D965
MSRSDYSLRLQLWNGRKSKQEFSTKMGYTGPTILKVQSVYHKGPRQIMVEFETPEDAQAARKITGWNLANQKNWSAATLEISFVGTDMVCRNKNPQGIVITEYYAHWEITME